MSILSDIGITHGNEGKVEKVFADLMEDFWDLKYDYPSDYIKTYWDLYLDYCSSLDISEKSNINNLNGKIFELILATLFVREGMLPLFIGAKVAFVPNVIYDLMIYSKERGPICFSAKTSLRERYKQADLEAIALKYVHRRALCYLITLDEKEAENNNKKIKEGKIIGLDNIVYAISKEFDDLIRVEVKRYQLEQPGSVSIIESQNVVDISKLKKS